MRYSIVIPVYNRPDEASELLGSLACQTFRDFEVIIVEDGSSVPCKDSAERLMDRLDIHYFAKRNSGPGPSRNFGVEHSHGEYVIILDSDCVVPEGYLAEIEKELASKDADAFGGPDRAHESFTDIQKAISWSMTSFLTTGGIRGGKRKMDKFYPRSFNMGMKASVYKALGGFSKMRFGEDIDLSIRIFKAGYSCRLFPEAWVWHKRRTDFEKFFRQVFNSGIARIHLYKKYPESLKLVHTLPAVFTIGNAALILATAVMRVLGAYGNVTAGRWWPLALLPIAIYCILAFADSSIRNRSVRIGLLSVAAAYCQLVGYGSGFLYAWYERCLSGKGEFSAFEKNFYN